ncbi:MAG: hypothetical protein R2709_02245 [Marmoricola sp.]
MASAALDAEMAKTACQVLKNFFPMEWSGEVPGSGTAPRQSATQDEKPFVKQSQGQSRRHAWCRIKGGAQ